MRPGPLGTYSQGKIDRKDAGDLRVAVTVDAKHKVVRIDFGTELTWLALDKATAKAFAELLALRADEL